VVFLAKVEQRVWSDEERGAGCRFHWKKRTDGVAVWVGCKRVRGNIGISYILNSVS